MEYTYEILREPWSIALLRHDPINILGFISIGFCDLDTIIFEYDVEVKKIVAAINEDPTVIEDLERFTLVVKSVFDYCFHEDYPLELCSAMANELLSTYSVPEEKTIESLGLKLPNKESINAVYIE